MWLGSKESKIYCYSTAEGHSVQSAVPLRNCEYKIWFFKNYSSNIMLVFTGEQIYCTKTPVIHSGLPNKFLVGETDK